ncbi:MAG: hypothetical protein AB1846_16630 [Chloroflexota bacterium]
MEQQILTIKPESKIVIETVPGDLRVRGWEQPELSAKTDGSELTITDDDGLVQISCDGDLILSLPQQAGIQVEKVEGDLNVRGLLGAVSVDKTENDAALSHVGSVDLGAVGGDLVLRHANGPVEVENVGGDASLRHIHGDLALDAVGADLYLRDARGSVLAVAGEDIVTYIEPLADASYTMTAGKDIVMRVPANVDLQITATAGGHNGIRVMLSGPVEEAFSGVYNATFGNGSAKASLTAGGGVLLTNRVDEWEARVDFDVDDGSFVWDKFASMGVDLGTRMADMGVKMGEMGAEIGNRVAERMAHVNIRSERVRERAEAAARRAELKAQAAMRRAEQKLRQSERQMERQMRHTEHRARHWNVSFENRPTPSTPPRPRVSDEERLTILRMLAEKKITAEQAEKLLSALEGGK